MGLRVVFLSGVDRTLPHRKEAPAVPPAIPAITILVWGEPHSHPGSAAQLELFLSSVSPAPGQVSPIQLPPLPNS